MNRRDFAWANSGASRALGLLALGLLTACGCAHQQQTRLQADDDTDRDKYEVKTVGDVTTVGNADPVIVAGIGLVTGLDGTGGDMPPGRYRSTMEELLRKRGVENPKAELASPNNAIVQVQAAIPPGARKGDPIDVQLTLPQGSRATSLRGGTLRECVLYNYESARNLDPNYQGPDTALAGHPLVKAKGPVVVGGGGDDAAGLRVGHVWQGGRCAKDMPFLLVLNPDQQFARMASAVADRINDRFHGEFRGGPGGEVASAQSKVVVTLNVPEQYKHNLPRFLRVVRLVPLRETLEPLKDNRLTAGGAGGVQAAARMSYRRRLEEDLLDPSRAVTAALRLEALGPDTLPALKRGLESEQVLVRFVSAEALAYMDSASCGEELGKLVEKQPALRAYGLTALASLNEAVSSVELHRLLAAEDAETRYGAFRALRVMDDRDADVQGELLNDSFRLHRVALASPGLVHLSSSRRAEVVLFGEEPRLVPPFSFLAGEFTVTAAEDDEKCTVSRFSVRHGTHRRQCSLNVEDVLRTLAELGGLYAETTELLRQAEKCRCISCPVVTDALPQATSVYELARTGGKELRGGDAGRKGGADLGVTPTLFEKDSVKHNRPADRDEEALLRDRKPANEKKTAERGRR